MHRYQGISGGDSITGGGAYIAEHGFGFEIYNFQNSSGSVYGYVQPPGRKQKWQESKINIQRLGAARNDRSVGNVLAIWAATAPSGGAFIVGWYQNATVFREWKTAPSGSNRNFANHDCGYFVSAKYEDAVLIPIDERVFSIPQHGIGNFGQSNVWYADDPVQHRQLRLDVLEYMKTRQFPRTSADSSPIQPDPYLRQQVEQAAIEATISKFKSLGYAIKSVEKDNVGWDLEATLDRRLLRLEVKGLSGCQTVVELTPNEYLAMKSYRDTYRVCVVTNALTNPNLEIFTYSIDVGRWESEKGNVLRVEEIIAARCSVP
jgi:hypothetical protein